MPRLWQNDGWEERADDLCHSDNFVVNIAIAPELYGALTQEERKRMEKKTTMVKAAAKRLMANQLKGTLKYPHDTRPSRVWLREMLDEQFDMLLYAMYAIEAMEREAREED